MTAESARSGQAREGSASGESSANGEISTNGLLRPRPRPRLVFIGGQAAPRGVGREGPRWCWVRRGGRTSGAEDQAVAAA